MTCRVRERRQAGYLAAVSNDGDFTPTDKRYQVTTSSAVIADRWGEQGERCPYYYGTPTFIYRQEGILSYYPVSALSRKTTEIRRQCQANNLILALSQS